MRALLGAVALAALLGSSACSRVRIAYGLLDTFIADRADSYFDFEPEQKKAFDAELQEYFAWHRKVVLPKAAAHARRSAEVFSKPGFTRAEFDRQADEMEALFKSSIGHFMPALARTMKGLSKDQIEHFAGELRDANDDIKSRLGRTDEDRAERMTQGFTRFMALLLVRPSHAQQQEMQALLRSRMEPPGPWLKDRRARGEALVALLRDRISTAEVERYLLAWAIAPEKFQSPEYQAQVSRFRALMRDLMFQYFSTLDEDRRKELKERLHHHAEDFEALSQAS
ncbi:MAG: hypothetical protein IT285_12830 [Bdellovibrionales bacterium]|nr:hypothetical protein [Bdellovibrionales bacterium]